MEASWPPALRIIIDAAEAASRGLRHGYIGTEHLLLGLLACDGTRAARRLTEAGATLERARSQVARVVGVGEDDDVGDQRLPYTPNAVAVCRRVAHEGGRSGPDAIGTEHVLRALLRRHSVGYYVVGELGIDADALADAARRPRPDDE